MDVSPPGGLGDTVLLLSEVLKLQIPQHGLPELEESWETKLV